MSLNIRLAGTADKSISLRMSLTQASVARLACPAARSRVFIYDIKTKGLAVMVTRKGSRSYYFCGRVKGQSAPIKFHIGEARAVPLDHARRAAMKIAVDAAGGIDPTKARKDAAAKAQRSKTVRQVWEAYRDDHLKPNCRKSTLITDENRYDNHLDCWSSRKVDLITGDDVAELHATIGKKKTKNAADKAVKLLRRMLAWAKIKPNPAGDGAVKFHGDNQRTRFLNQDEVGRLFEALDHASNQTYADAIRFALLTGARRGNASSAKWSDLHLEHSLWIIPEDQSKNKKPLTINLPPPAVELLQRRKDARLDLDNPYVFPGRFENSHIHDLTWAWYAVRDKAKLKDVRFHDLRHTIASHMAMNGASLLVIGKQLGHASKQSSARYAHLELEAIRSIAASSVAKMISAPKQSG